MEVEEEELSLDGQLQGLIDAVDLARDERSIRNAIKKFAVSSGFDRYAYIHVHGDDAVVFSDYPAEWLSLYFAKHYTTIDPVVTTAKRTMRMFAWSAEERELRRSSRDIKQFYSEATDFGIRSGVSVPIRTSYGRTAMITLASDRQRVEVPPWDPMQAALALAYIHVRLSLASGSSFKTGNVTLSTQEATSLSWSSHGKSMNVIADLLGIRPRTVQFYLDNARDKLGASNLQQAVRIAMEKKLI
ncbi:LuxR family transcriptional activator of conjugal transfer of Ti plasmids [Bradyrhizobium diazoefficiens]|uniref:autoinducer binding domain-containing protein n=1 Tax=Bradyrhizobium diazoefficiens TaxID=1355477 RepID=UPI00359508A0